ncbi:helix-turn-helix domain-containing protein [Ramlibacter ginsenosidimutans]|uniref:Helix-turn-helix domain-containing protein n=1 Tax=Ramlibacter ginsenosidimutans TaxID=502333 RepID=A0A934WLS5_9BURK|nr:helix-turn-helix domain-containing protein [Ramlibacter ginsenosidimutans]
MSPTCCQFPVFRIGAFGESVRSHHFDFARLEKRMSLLPYPHRHDFFHVVWVAHGSGHHIIDSERYEVKPDTLFFMSPGQVHDFQLSEDATGYTINFSSEFFSLQLQNKKILHEIPVYKPESPIAAVYMTQQQAVSLRPVIDDIAAEYEAEEGGYEDVLRSYLAIFLIKASRFAEPVACAEPAMRALMLTRRFKALLEQHFRSVGDAAEYARMLRVTERALSEATRRALGATANKLIRDRVMLEAKSLLLHSAVPVSQIADQLAFEDPAYFSRAFKKHTGRSPQDYRQALANLHTESPRTPAVRPNDS